MKRGQKNINLGLYTFPKYSFFQHYHSKEMFPVNTDRICCFKVLRFLSLKQ